MQALLVLLGDSPCSQKRNKASALPPFQLLVVCSPAPTTRRGLLRACVRLLCLWGCMCHT